MDTHFSQKNKSTKNGALKDEVVLLIADDGKEKLEPSLQHANENDHDGLSKEVKPTPSAHPSPGKNSFSCSSADGKREQLPLKPPLPEAYPRRRTSFAKPKSRFEEQPPALEKVKSPPPPTHSSPGGASPLKEVNNAKASGTPNTPSSSNVDEEDEEEEEVYKMEQSMKCGKEKGSCWKVKVSIEWIVLVMATVCLIVSLTVKKLEGFVIWGLEIWKWCVMVMVIFCGRLFTSWLVVFIVFLIERNFLFKKKVLYFVYGIRKSFQVCIWFALVLLSWTLLFNRGVRRSKKTTKILEYVTRALISLLVGSVMWLVKTLLVKLFASSFHVSRFFDRIQDSVFKQYVIQTLSVSPAVVSEEERVGFSKKNINKQLSFKSGGNQKNAIQEVGKIDVTKLKKIRQEKVSAWTMKGLMNVISSGFLTISNVIDNSFNGEEVNGGVGKKDEEITNEWEAKVVGYRIFKNVSKPGSKYIDEEDLLRFLTREEVDIVLPTFDGASETGKIAKKALKIWVVKAYLERKSLAHSLNDTKTAVEELHRLASVIVVIIAIIVSLLIMGFATTQVLVLISSQLLLVAFIFGNMCKTAFEAIIFVFVMHPFDVGDRVVIDGVQMTVEEMNILTTVFLRYDNEKIYYPNAVLAVKPISNFYRSPDMNDSVEFSIDFFTSVEKIGTLKSRIKSYIESKNIFWHPNHSLVLKDIVNVNKLNFALYVQHTMNFQDIVEKNSRRTELVLEMKKILEDLSIRYNLLPQEVNLSYISEPLPFLTR